MPPVELSTLSPASRKLILAAAFATLVQLMLLARVSTLSVGQHVAAETVRYVPRAEAMRLGSLRHNELGADLMWIRAVLYYGEMFFRPTRGATVWLERYLDVLLGLDPRFERVYRWAGTMFIYRTGKVTRQDVERANAFLERGVREFPASWELWFILGSNYLFEVKPKDEAERRELRRKAADAIARASDLPGRPDWAPVLAATLFSHQGEVINAIQVLERTIPLTPEKERPKLYGKLIQLRSQEAALAIERETKEFDRRWKASFPYLPASLFVLVGDREQPRTLAELLEPPETVIEDPRTGSPSGR